MTKLTPLVKGIITGVTMLGLTLILHYTKQPTSSSIHYLLYVLYAGGITWTLIDHSRSANYSGKFGDLFGQGFRCFIIVTLIMIVFTGIFSASHPEFAEKDAKSYKEYLMETKDKKEAPGKDKTQVEIDEMAGNYKKHYTTGLIYSAIFGYLIVGSILTAAGAGILLMRRK